MELLRNSFLVACIFLLAGCFPSRSLVVLLPDDEGNVGQIEVESATGTVVVDKAYRSVGSVSLLPPGQPEEITKDSIDSIFGAAFDTEPRQRYRFRKRIFYFYLNSIELLPSSKDLLTETIEKLLDETPAEIYIVGHADRAGTEYYNSQLSHSRAAAVRQVLVDSGVAGKIITISSLGETMPAVKTADEVLEPKNRRAELVLKYRRSGTGL